MAAASSNVSPALVGQIIPMEGLSSKRKLPKWDDEMALLQGKIDVLPIEECKSKLTECKARMEEARLHPAEANMQFLEATYYAYEKQYKALLELKEQYSKQIQRLNSVYMKAKNQLKRSAEEAELKVATEKSPRDRKKVKKEARCKIKWDIKEVLNCFELSITNENNLNKRVYVLGCIQAGGGKDVTAALLQRLHYAIINPDPSITFKTVLIENQNENLLTSPAHTIGSVIRFSMPAAEVIINARPIKKLVNIVLLDNENKRWTSKISFVFKKHLSGEAQKLWEKTHKKEKEPLNAHSTYHHNNKEMLSKLKAKDPKAFEHLTTFQRQYCTTNINRYERNIFPEIN